MFLPSYTTSQLNFNKIKTRRRNFFVNHEGLQSDFQYKKPFNLSFFFFGVWRGEGSNWLEENELYLMNQGHIEGHWYIGSKQKQDGKSLKRMPGSGVQRSFLLSILRIRRLFLGQCISREHQSYWEHRQDKPVIHILTKE